MDTDASSIRALQDPASPFHDAHSGGAEIVGLPLRLEKIQEFLLSCTHLRHGLLRVQKRILSGDSIKHWESYIEKILGLSPTEARAAHPLQSTDRASSRSLGDDLAEATERCSHLELALTESEGEIKHLRNQLEQTQAEYASLRSELQLNDNTEQSRIVQSLKDLNRCIENLGRSIAEHIADCYIPAGADDDTTLKAKDLFQIKAQFRHQEGKPSLVTSSSGDGMPIEDFFDLGIRSMLCRRLYENIFLPFHPTLSGDPRNEFMNELYREIRYRDHQTTASKWRANSFLAISNGHDTTTRIEHIHKHAENIKAQDLAILFTNFFGKNVQISLTDLHNEEIERLVSLAWDWNVTLKGSVVMLGDFQPTIYDSGVPFNPECMADFEPKKGSRRAPDIVLCTVGLGLTVSRSKTAGNSLGQSIVCKATVVTEYIYE
ncbi:hypothetical protein FRC12_019179 [Ceratobasidium sp. 428]|nr:hypothetical protein FRC12_019179 [Ceratobasidium sp. 428]